MYTTLLACYGLTFLVRDSMIAQPLRSLLRKSAFLRSMLDCAFCTGFWVSLAVMAADGRPLVVGAFAGAVVCLFADAVLTLLERHVELLEVRLASAAARPESGPTSHGGEAHGG